MSRAQTHAREFHLTLRVHDLERSTRFYTWLLDVPAKVESARHSVIVDVKSGTNLVLIAAGASADGSANIHHLGVGCADRDELLEMHQSASRHGIDIVEPPHTTWGGTPLHQMWLRDPDGHRVEIYARLTEAELAKGPTDGAPLGVS